MSYLILIYSISLFVSLLTYSFLNFSMVGFLAVWMGLNLFTVGAYCKVRFQNDTLGGAMLDGRFTFFNRFLEFLEHALLISFILSVAGGIAYYLDGGVNTLAIAFGNLLLTYFISSIRTALKNYMKGW